MADQVTSQVPGQIAAGQPGGSNPAGAQGQTGSQGEGENKKPKWLWWAIGAGVVIVLAIGAYFLFFR